jgi:hypothetical protein
MSIPPISSVDPQQQGAARRGSDVGSAWTGWIAFAGTIMVMLGVFHAIQGLVALFNSDYYVASDRLIIHLDYTGWGWVQLIGGIIVAAAGVCVFMGQLWARTVGVIVAMVSAVINIGFLSAVPLWSAMMIALDVTVILALTVHGSEVRER